MNVTEKLAMQQTRDMEKRIAQNMNALVWSRETLKAHRQSRLRQLLAYAKQHSPWYKRQLAGINLDNFTEERLPELPTLDKVTLMNHWNEIITVPGLTLAEVEDHVERMLHDENAHYLRDRYHVMVTGGSSGRRGVFIYDWDEWNDYYLMFRRYKLYQQDPKPLLNPKRKVILALVSSANAIHGIYSLSKTFKSRYTQFVHFPLSLPIEKIIEGLNELQPDVLQGSPFSLYRLAKEALTGTLLISPKTVNVFAEPFHPEIRQTIEQAWVEAELFNTYGTSEGLSALCCTSHRKEMHLNDDMCIVEPVDLKGKSVEKGQCSAKIYMTNLFNFTLPLIRYQIDDELLFLDKECDCSIKHQLIAEPLSRPDIDFIYANNRVVRTIIFTAALLQDRYIQEYQVIQTQNGADIKLLANGEINKPRLHNMLSNSLKKLGLPEPELNFIPVSHFEYPPSGKLKRFIPLTIHSLNWPHLVDE